jgi:hypothetical protein
MDPPITAPADPPPTDPPITDPPVTDPPVTDPPVTDPPVTTPPVTTPPVTTPPVTAPPVTKPPSTTPPTTPIAPVPATLHPKTHSTKVHTTAAHEHVPHEHRPHSGVAAKAIRSSKQGPKGLGPLPEPRLFKGGPVAPGVPAPKSASVPRPTGTRSSKPDQLGLGVVVLSAVLVGLGLIVGVLSRHRRRPVPDALI